MPFKTPIKSDIGKIQLAYIVLGIRAQMYCRRAKGDFWVTKEKQTAEMTRKGTGGNCRQKSNCDTWPKKNVEKQN